ncbi:hypothetical protein, partial [Oleiphilus sp. HI0061]|uniref:hypothetical protein n=1 Tax=Oleiphilus sp. HI0061 TaxID=1822239 RepID=UPI0012E99105
MTNGAKDLFLEELNEQEKFWCLILLYELGVYKDLGGSHYDYYDIEELRVLESCGVNTGCDKKYGKESEEQFNRKEEKKQKFRIAIKSAYLGLLDTLGALAYEVTNPNILNLSFSLGLNEVETKLVNFVVSLKSKV